MHSQVTIYQQATFKDCHALGSASVLDESSEREFLKDLISPRVLIVFLACQSREGPSLGSLKLLQPSQTFVKDQKSPSEPCKTSSKSRKGCPWGWQDSFSEGKVTSAGHRHTTVNCLADPKEGSLDVSPQSQNLSCLYTNLTGLEGGSGLFWGWRRSLLEQP